MELQQKERYFYIDIVKFVLIFTFMLSHFFPHNLGVVVYWNTGGFVLLSGYISGILLPNKPLDFAYGAVKFLKINLWLVLYFLLIYIMCTLVGRSDVVFRMTTGNMSVLEYIALFYLLLPFMGLVKYKRFASVVVITIIIVTNYVVLNINFLKSSTIVHIINLLLVGGESPYYHYPLLSFVNIGVLGFFYSMIENSIPFRKLVMILLLFSFGIIYGLNQFAFISVWVGRFPPLLFYIIFSLAVLSNLLDGSRMLSKLISNPFLKKLITNSAKYSLIIFVIHHPAIIILKKFKIHEIMFDRFVPDLVLFIIFTAILNIVLCYFIDNTIRRFPIQMIRKIL